MKPVFVAVEGPNGVGKSTIARELAARMPSPDGCETVLTTEPTRSPLGELLRRSESSLQGRALALALAADRADHIDSVIIPALDRGQHVISDRYVQSSMVLQRIDGLDPDEIWLYNQYALPAATIYLEDDPGVIAGRLRARASLTRLEVKGTPERELAYYREAKAFLAHPDHRWPQHTIACHDRTPQQVVDEILNLLMDTTAAVSESSA